VSPAGRSPANTPMTSRAAGGTLRRIQLRRVRSPSFRPALARNPDDLEAHLALARLYVGRETGWASGNETARVLERPLGKFLRPRLSVAGPACHGQTDVAVGMLTKALAADPDLIDATCI